ncbi:MAG: hemolysin III family protein [Acidobacteria bacterium]|nr:hemolysin III family protein [Acidobacteriota bacterium]NIM63883.1 hemolysin III family protein [Acidobacteriota bacterium]NIO60152.1 hemolysin III family protein [Acidobacteriota bacterium]NIQ31216.1 hemolysin III family protein [Acidobacteriota bacterium]NIQ86353.1 hemolysin III family protein [Acidobacteriota bacterium]
MLSTELANGITHGVGFVLSQLGLVALVIVAVARGSARHVVACSIYGATLVLLYLASTLYHSVRAPRAKRILRLIDHISIYLLIAGTYTPFTLVTLRGGWGWSLFGVIWGLALVGTVFKLFVPPGRWEAVSMVLYLAMGWLAIVAFRPLQDSLATAGMVWVFAGGLAYTIGVVFYFWESILHHHAIWHIFVMLGSACHFFAVMFYVLPSAS